MNSFRKIFVICCAIVSFNGFASAMTIQHSVKITKDSDFKTLNLELSVRPFTQLNLDRCLGSSLADHCGVAAYDSQIAENIRLVGIKKDGTPFSQEGLSMMLEYTSTGRYFPHVPLNRISSVICSIVSHETHQQLASIFDIPVHWENNKIQRDPQIAAPPANDKTLVLSNYPNIDIGLDLNLGDTSNEDLQPYHSKLVPADRRGYQDGVTGLSKVVCSRYDKVKLVDLPVDAVMADIYGK